MAFMTSLLRFFVAIGIALWIIAGGVFGWFYETLPGAAGQLSVAAPAMPVAEPTLALRIVGSLVGCVVGLFFATVTFGVIALMLDIRDRLVIIADSAQGGRRVSLDS